MAKNTSALNATTKEKSKKMTKAEFLVALDEINATLQANIAQAHENQLRIEAKNKELRASAAETRKIIEAL